jgi:hypothetical protein
VSDSFPRLAPLAGHYFNGRDGIVDEGCVSMAEEESLVAKRREVFSDALLPQNTDELAKFMEQPLTAIAESITGALAAGPKAWTVMTGHIVQGILKGKLYQQVALEIKELRANGKIPGDFADEKKYKYGFKSWVELLTVIDDETPDADRLEALKAMFYAVNKVTATDGEKVAAYQLFQIAKKLTSGQLLYLKACYSLYKAGHYQSGVQVGIEVWLRGVSAQMGHQVIGLLDLDDQALAGYTLLHRRHPDAGSLIQNDARLTDLGKAFCRNIESYQVEVSPKPGGE